MPFPGESFVAVALKHVHEPPPNLLDVRGDIPLRVAAAVDRALEKDPEQRFPTMAAFAAELEASLAELDRDDEGDATMVIPAARRAAPPRKQVSHWPLIIGVLALLAIAAIVVGLLTVGGGTGGTPATLKPVAVTAVTSYDPFASDQDEHSELAARATDGNRATYWTTEDYRDDTMAGKKGVGVVVDAGTVVSLSRITLVTDTPGFKAEIEATNVLGGSPTKVSDNKVVGRTTSFDIDESAPKRYYVVWITNLPSGGTLAHVNEVRAFTG